MPEQSSIRHLISEKRETDIHEEVKNTFFDMTDKDPNVSQGDLIKGVYEKVSIGKLPFEIFLAGNMLMYFIEWYRKQQLMAMTKERMKGEILPKESSEKVLS